MKLSICLVSLLLLNSISCLPCACQEESKSNEPSVLLSTHGTVKKKLLAQSIPIAKTIDQVPISKRAKRLAQDLNITEFVVELYNAKREEIDPSTTLERKFEILYDRQKISDRIRYSVLQVQDTLAAIDLDIAHMLRLYDHLDSKKSKYDQKINVLTFLTTGVFTILNGALGYVTGTIQPVNTTGIAAGASSALLPFLSYRKHNYLHPDPSTETPNMLAQIFDQPTDSRTKYGELVWNFLNSPDGGDKSSKTRRQRILSEWARLRDLKEVSKEEIDVLTGTRKRSERVTLDVLNARANLLSDLRAEIAGFYRDLAHLQKELIIL